MIEYPKLLFPVVYLWSWIQNLFLFHFFKFILFNNVIVLSDLLIISLQLYLLVSVLPKPKILIIFFILLATPLRVPKSYFEFIIVTFISLAMLFKYPYSFGIYAPLFVSPRVLYWVVNIMFLLFNFQAPKQEYQKFINKIKQLKQLKRPRFLFFHEEVDEEMFFVLLD